MHQTALVWLPQYPAAASSTASCDSLLVATTGPKDLSVQLQLYPNPTTGAVTLELPTAALPAVARLFDTQGRKLNRRDITETLTHWILPDLGASKALLLHLQSLDGRTTGRLLRIE